MYSCEAVTGKHAFCEGCLGHKAKNLKKDTPVSDLMCGHLGCEHKFSTKVLLVVFREKVWQKMGEIQDNTAVNAACEAMRKDETEQKLAIIDDKSRVFKED